MNKDKFKKSIITYDYNERLLFPEKTKRQPLFSYPSKLSFSVQHSPIKEHTESYNKISENEDRSDSSMYDVINIKIEPIYRVQYNND